MAGSVFGAPTGDFMGITVFRNGSLARERVRDQFGMTWTEFSAALRSTPAGNGGALMLPWFEPEITPEVLSPSVHVRGLPAANAAANIRAVVEGQMMSMANHSRWLGVDVHAIHATGGASENPEVLQVMADVFGADVYRFESTNSACLGAAIRAFHADRLAAGQPINWDDAIAGLAEPQAQPIRPNPKHVVLYRDLRRRYAAFEAETIGKPLE
jgi:xylulokinase